MAIGDKPSTERLAALNSALDETRKSGELHRAIVRDKAYWLAEIAKLESRVYTEAVDIDLGNGATLAIRTCLSGIEAKRLNELDDAHRVETDHARKTELASEMLEMITLSPLITKEWLLENQDKYSPSDVLRALMGFMEVRMQEQADRADKIRSAIRFRPE
jgi:hypothetical protein